MSNTVTLAFARPATLSPGAYLGRSEPGAVARTADAVPQVGMFVATSALSLGMLWAAFGAVPGM